MKLFRKTKKGVILSSKGFEEINNLFQLARDIESMQVEMDRIKEEFKKEMEERSLEDFGYNDYVLKVRKPYVRIRKTVNYDILKEKGIYNQAVKEKEEKINSVLTIKIHI